MRKVCVLAVLSVFAVASTGCVLPKPVRGGDGRYWVPLPGSDLMASDDADAAKQARWNEVRRRREEAARREKEKSAARAEAEQKMRDKIAAKKEQERLEQAGRASGGRNDLGIQGKCKNVRFSGRYSCATGANRAQLLSEKSRYATPVSQAVRNPSAARASKPRTDHYATSAKSKAKPAIATRPPKAKTKTTQRARGKRLDLDRVRRKISGRAIPPADCDPSVFGSCPLPNESLVSEFPGASSADAPGYASGVGTRGAATGCAQVEDEYDELLTFSALKQPSPELESLPGRISRAVFAEDLQGSFRLVPDREGAAIGLVRTNDGHFGKFLFDWSAPEGEDGKPLVTLVDATVYTHEAADGAPRVWAPIPLEPYDGIDLDIPDAAPEGLVDEVDVVLRPGDDGVLYLEAVNGAALEFPTQSLCPSTTETVRSHR